MINRNPPAKDSKAGSIFGAAFLFLFSLPFAGMGLFAICRGIGKWINGSSKDGWMEILFGAIFSAVGFGLMYGVVWGTRKSRQTAALQARDPDKPWLWRADWAAGRIQSSASAQANIYAIMGFAFCGLGGASTYAALSQELPKGNYAALLVLLFPAVGIVFLVAAARAKLARRRFGDSVFEMATVPGALGGTLEGVIQTGARLRREHGLHLKLSCIRRVVSGSGKDSTTTITVLWQDEKVFKTEADLPEPEPGHSGIPVFFKLPADQPECYSRGRESVNWQLEARAEMSGPDFAASFNVPVFPVAGAAAAAANEADPTTELQMPVAELRRDEHSKIQVSDGPNGREFFFPAARNVGAAMSLTAFFLVWTAITVVLWHFHQSGLFEVAFGLVDVLVAILCFHIWFKSSRVTINANGLTAVDHWLFLTRSRRFDAGAIIRFETRVGMTSGTRVYQDLRLITQKSEGDFAANKARFQQTGALSELRVAMSSPGGLTLASSIASKPEADWLVAEMTRALGRAGEQLS